MAEQKQLTPMQAFNKSIMNPATQEYIQSVIGEKKQTFVNNIVALVSSNANLQACKPMTVVYSALKATALGLAVDPALGQAWVLPYNSKNGPVAQFQMGAKGYIQLAMRTGKFKRLNVSEVKEGELKENDVITGDIVIEAVADRSSKPTIGYVAYFRLNNGFEKMIYKSVEDIKAHGKRFSKSFTSGPWQSDFDAMAKKTVLKELISKWAPLSVEDVAMNEALKYDQSVIDEQDGEPNYMDGYSQEERVENAVNERKAELRSEGVQPDNLL